MVSAQFKGWLKANVNIKLSSDAAVLRITKEGITGWDSLIDFDKKSIERLPSICKEKIPEIVANVPNGIVAEAEVPGARCQHQLDCSSKTHRLSQCLSVLLSDQSNDGPLCDALQQCA